MTSTSLRVATIVDTPWMTAMEWTFLASTFSRLSAFARDMSDPVRSLGEITTPNESKVTIKEFELDAFRRSLRDSDALLIGGGDKSLLDKETLRQATTLKYIGVHATGYEHIPLTGVQELREDGRDVVMTHVAGYSTHSVAEFAVGGVLSTMRRFHTASKEYVQDGSKHPFGAPQGETLRGKTVLLIGLGNIGLAVADLTNAFGCQVAYVGRKRKQRAESDRPWLRWAGQLNATAQLEKALRGADIVSLHVTDLGHEPLLTSERLASLRPGAIVVNTARASLVDNAALMDLVKRGSVVAVLDVDDLPDPKRYRRLIAGGRLVFTHHVAFNTADSAHAKAKIFIGNLQGYAAGMRGRDINEIAPH